VSIGLKMCIGILQNSLI